MRKTILMVFLALAGFSAGAQENEPRAVALIEGFERKLNLEGSDITADFTLIQKKPGEADRVLRLNIFRRDAAGLFTIIFTYPDSEQGKGYFRQGDDLYLYLPTTREFVYRNRKDDIGSTDVRTDIFGRLTNLDKFKVRSLGKATVSKWECEVVRFDAKVPDVSFPIQKWYVRASDGLPVKVENFSASETLLRTFYYVDFKPLGAGKYIFTRFLAVNDLEQGQRTLITVENVRTTRIEDYVFTKAYLERQAR
jgi:hypothetical protein